MVMFETQTLGYPRIGADREIKRALEAYWKGKLDEDSLWKTFWQVTEAGWQTQLAAGITYIGVGSASLYDLVLDWAVRFGLVAERFQSLSGLNRYFAMARGAAGIPALELTKWFDTNYHYLVPEIDADRIPQADFADFLSLVRRAVAQLGERAVPIILGPVTLLRLSRLPVSLPDLLRDQWGSEFWKVLIRLYEQLLHELRALGVDEVQLHEPGLVLGDAGDLRKLYELAYTELAQTETTINLVTYFDDLGQNLPWVSDLPVDILTLDFTRGRNLELLAAQNWPEDKILAAGLVDGRNVWRIRPGEIQSELSRLESIVVEPYRKMRLSISCSLQFVPYSAARETELPEAVRDVLSFAEEKLDELIALAKDKVEANTSAWWHFAEFVTQDIAIQKQYRRLVADDFRRSHTYEERRKMQVALPLYPITTIGSFPQTTQVRRLRAQFRNKEISAAEYQAGIDAFIAYTVGVQEGLGLDVLVHGEFERTDMVEYFAHKMSGFAFTSHGWVQSFGTRYVRPPIIYTDVSRPAPMTVREFAFASSLTQKPVKGMLTGPVTILNWSYPRNDISRKEIAYQIALALRDEIADLEAAGDHVIQVDEPALREGLPLKPERWPDYLSWAVDAFRLATAKAKPETQIHTHMCYSEFGVILSAIDRLDTDVISIENARSDDATLRELADYGYAREVGPGVYDIHSPIVPDSTFIEEKLRMFLKYLKPGQIWVNPDCGLKTRSWEEVLPALRNIVAVVRKLRAEAQS